MSMVKIAAFSVSFDGFGARPRQDLRNPLGIRGFELHSWFVVTDVFKKMNDGAVDVDDQRDVSLLFHISRSSRLFRAQSGHGLAGPVARPGISARAVDEAE